MGLTFTSGFFIKTLYSQLALGKGSRPDFRFPMKGSLIMICVINLWLWNTQHSLCLQISFCERKKGKFPFVYVYIINIAINLTTKHSIVGLVRLQAGRIYIWNLMSGEVCGTIPWFCNCCFKTAFSCWKIIMHSWVFKKRSPLNITVTVFQSGKVG